MEYLIEVSFIDIAKGQHKNCFYCPIANAIKRVTGLNAKVTWSDITIGKKRFYTSQRMKDFIIQYDFTGNVNPFSFNLVID